MDSKVELPSEAGRQTLADQLRAGTTTVWLGPIARARTNAPGITIHALDSARARMQRFQPVLRHLFPESGWDGIIRSELLDYPVAPAGIDALRIKADHALPVTGSIKARGGIYDLLCRIERIAIAEGLIGTDGDYSALVQEQAHTVLSRFRIVVASTGNLGYSIGLAARAFGLAAQVHMSHDAKRWKKDRLIALGVDVVEHPFDYSQTVEAAEAAARAAGDEFIDDTSSRDLMIGYALAGDEVIEQLAAAGVVPTPQRPLIVYLPCGVGGAPGGVTFALKERLGAAVRCVFVEPVASPCMMVALAAGGMPVPVYAHGLSNETIADGLAVPLASELVLDTVGDRIDAVVALPDAAMLEWVARAWREAGLRLEPSAAAALAAIAPFVEAAPHLRDAVHVAWATGGSLLPDEEFAALLRAADERVHHSS
ncbi:MAG: D-serine ammonia-lyase [Sphingomonadales bacterium]|nr:MAG: D-serine ammonia-lyase [Sphingomonadales bacterium]